MKPRPQASEARAQESPVRRTTLRVRYADTDQMGVVYYANYLVWFEVGRTEWLRDAGWNYRELEEHGTHLPVIEAHCDYTQPARYDDEIEIRTRAALITPVRIRFDYEVVRTADETSCAAGYTVHASLDAAGRPCRLPPRVLEMLA